MRCERSCSRSRSGPGWPRGAVLQPAMVWVECSAADLGVPQLVLELGRPPVRAGGQRAGRWRRPLDLDPPRGSRSISSHRGERSDRTPERWRGSRESRFADSEVHAAKSGVQNAPLNRTDVSLGLRGGNRLASRGLSGGARSIDGAHLFLGAGSATHLGQSRPSVGVRVTLDARVRRVSTCSCCTGPASK